MDDKRKQRHLHDIDRVLAEVRRDLGLVESTPDQYELRALQLLLEVARAMHSVHDVHTLITIVLDSALIFADADRAFLMLFEEGKGLRFKMGRAADGAYLSADEFVISTSVVRAALEGQKPIILVDAQQDEQFSKRQSIVDLDLRTVMAAPLRANDAVIGLIYVDSHRPLAHYTDHHFNVLSSLADQAAVAIINAQKFDTHHP